IPISAPSWAISEMSAGWRSNTTAGIKKVGAPPYCWRVSIILYKAWRIGVSETPNRVNTVPSRLVKLCAPFVLIEKETRFIAYLHNDLEQPLIVLRIEPIP